jgi:hypothetical protein
MKLLEQGLVPLRHPSQYIPNYKYSVDITIYMYNYDFIFISKYKIQEKRRSSEMYLAEKKQTNRKTRGIINQSTRPRGISAAAVAFVPRVAATSAPLVHNHTDDPRHTRHPTNVIVALHEYVIEVHAVDYL